MSIKKIILLGIGILWLLAIIYVASLWLIFNRDVRFEEQKDKEYQHYKQTPPSILPSGNRQ